MHKQRKHFTHGFAALISAVGLFALLNTPAIAGYDNALNEVKEVKAVFDVSQGSPKVCCGLDSITGSQITFRRFESVCCRLLFGDSNNHGALPAKAPPDSSAMYDEVRRRFCFRPCYRSPNS